jgi:hypothetical protein
MVSELLPAANGTISRSGRSGQSARAPEIASTEAAKASKKAESKTLNDRNI